MTTILNMKSFMLMESISNLSEPTYYNMNMFGMSVRSTGRLVDVSQLRYWIPGGVEVDRTYPGAFIFDDQTDDFGRSNLFTDLIWYLLTNKDTGSGDIVSTAMLDKPSFELTSKFLVQNRIFCDTVVQDPINIREYATQLAPLMLCNFVMKAGEFAVVPGIPVTSTGAIDTGRLVPDAVFSEGNIIADSFKVEYLPEEDRAPFKASGTYREGLALQQLKRKTSSCATPAQLLPVMTEPTSKAPCPWSNSRWLSGVRRRDQAVLACKYMLALRKHVTHTVTFKTSPDGLALAPGDYIKVETESNPFYETRVGTVSETGEIVSVEPIEDGTYIVQYYTGCH